MDMVDVLAKIWPMVVGFVALVIEPSMASI